MKKEYKVNGKVTYPQGVVSRTTYTLIDDVGNMINLNTDTTICRGTAGFIAVDPNTVPYTVS